MSKCISSEGEYSDHECDDRFVCERCFSFDEAAALGEIDRLRTALARVTDPAKLGEYIFYLTAGSDWEAASDSERTQCIEAASDFYRAAAEGREPRANPDMSIPGPTLGGIPGLTEQEWGDFNAAMGFGQDEQEAGR